jgi:electron transport complex protein RnfB
MHEDERVYRKLQEHLDKQAICYPATQSGVEVRILKRLFKPEEARLATHLSYKPRSVQQIYETVKGSGMPLRDMESMLDAMVRNGVTKCIERGGTRYFFSPPFIMGMWEAQVDRLTPEFLAEFEEYTNDITFGLEYFNRGFSQIRTIPVEKSLPIERHVATYDHITEIINGTDGPFVRLECICRRVAAMKGRPCQRTSRLDVCMVLGDWARNYIRSGVGIEIGKAEALETIRQNEVDGLVLQPSNTQNVEFLCACCSCCCMMLGAHKMMPRPVDFWLTNYYAAIDSENCTGCGDCVKRCQVNALSMDESLGIASINLDRCIGCGVCVTSCPLGAIRLLEKEKVTVPPVDLESLYDGILAKGQSQAARELPARIGVKKVEEGNHGEPREDR